MTLGFFLWAALGFIIGGALGPIQTKFALFVVLYGIFNSLGEMGPGVATFLCGAESFPTPLRGHFLGLAAAVGKAGAAIGTQVTKDHIVLLDLHIDKNSQVFTPIQNSFPDAQRGIQGVFLIGAAFALVGGLISWFLIPDRSRDLETEDEQYRLYLERNGWQASFGQSLAEEVKSTTLKF